MKTVLTTCVAVVTGVLISSAIGFHKITFIFGAIPGAAVLLLGLISRSTRFKDDAADSLFKREMRKLPFIDPPSSISSYAERRGLYELWRAAIAAITPLADSLEDREATSRIAGTLDILLALEPSDEPNELQAYNSLIKEWWWACGFFA